VEIFRAPMIGPRQPDIVRAVDLSQLFKVHADMAGFFTPTQIGSKDRELDALSN
jgi:hypothetical protein